MECRYDAQGNYTCHAKQPFKEDYTDQYVYKDRKQPKGCSNCPIGSYAHTCSECHMLEFDYQNDKPALVLECKCKKNVYEKGLGSNKTILGINGCGERSVDIANCDGTLTCGKCYGTTFYSFDGTLIG